MASLLKSFSSLMITRCAGYDYHHPPQPSRPMAFAMGNTPEGARLGKFPFSLKSSYFPVIWTRKCSLEEVNRSVPFWPVIVSQITTRKLFYTKHPISVCPECRYWVKFTLRLSIHSSERVPVRNKISFGSAHFLRPKLTREGKGRTGQGKFVLSRAGRTLWPRL